MEDLEDRSLLGQSDNARFFNSFLKISHLRVLSLLSEVGLVSQVAKRLNLSQSAVSKQIIEIDRALGTPVVFREKNRVFLTPVGRQLAYHADQVLKQIRRSELEVAAMRKGLRGTVRVGSVTSVSPLLLPETLALFLQSAPNAEVSLVEGHINALRPSLESGALDVLIGRVWTTPVFPGISHEVLLSEPLSVVSGPQHPLAACSEVGWPDLMEWPWILSPTGSIAREAIDAQFAGANLDGPSQTVESVSLPLNVALLQKLPMISLFPRRLAIAHARRGEIVILPQDVDTLLSEVRCFWRSDAPENNHTLELFLNCLRQAADASGS